MSDEEKTLALEWVDANGVDYSGLRVDHLIVVEACSAPATFAT